MAFSDDFQNLFIESLDSAEASKPKIIIIEKEPGASILPVMSAMGIAEMAGTGVWTAYAGDRSQPLFEQLLPKNMKKVLNIEKPPRIELALLANESGMNMGTVSRDDSSLDPDIISGMMAAVRNFVKDSLSIHAGKELAERGVERFEMQGYNILVCQGNLLNLTLILSGSIPDQLVSEMKRVLGQIEDTNQELLANWQGSMNAIEGVEKPVHTSFFASKQYEGEWDFQQMSQHKSKMYDSVLNIVEKQSRDIPLVIVAEDLDQADFASLQLLSYVLRNLETSKVLFLGTHGVFDSIDEKLKDIVGSFGSLEYSKSMKQQSEINLSQMIEKIPEENKETVNTVLRHGAIIGTLDLDTLQDSTGIGRLELSDALEEMMNVGFVSGSGQHLNPSIGDNVLSGLREAERTEITESGALALESNHPEKTIVLAELFCWLAENKPEYKNKAINYAVASAENYMNNFNVESSTDMWVKAYEFSDDIDDKSLYLYTAIEQEVECQWDNMETHAKELLNLSDISKSEKYRGLAHWGMSFVSNKAGDFETSISHLETAETLLKSAEDYEKLAQVLNSKGVFFLQKGKNEEALEIFRETEMLCNEQNNLSLKSIVLVNMAYIHMSHGNLHESEKILDEAYEIAINAGLEFAKITILWHMAMLSYHQEDYEKGVKHCLEALDAGHGSGYWTTIINCLTVLAVMYQELGQDKLSHEKSMEAYKMAKKTDLGDLLALTHNIFKYHAKEQSIWLERAVNISKGPNAHAETLRAAKEELVEVLINELSIMSAVLDSSISEENRLKLAQQLKELISQLDK